MASPASIRKLLLRYFNEAPIEETAPYLEIMYLALTEGQRAALRNIAKAYLLPKLQAEFVAVSGTLASFEASYVTHTEDLVTLVSGAGYLVEEMESF